MKTKGGQQNKFLRIITIPFRALGKARDLYVRSMTSYANKVGYGTNYMGTNTTTYATVLPKSFSANSSRADDNEDLRELIRAASARSIAEKMDINHLILQHQMMVASSQHQQLRPPQPPQSRVGGVVAPKAMPPRSTSVGMARIDEERPYSATADAGGVGDGGENFGKSSSKKSFFMRRSKTYAVNKKNPFSD